MEVYSSNDLEVFVSSYDDIINKVKIAQAELLEPTKKESDQVMNIITKFTKNKKRKLYGGYALNILLKHKSLKEAIYSDYDLPDLDFYTPQPVEDIIELCNILHDEKFVSIQGKEAQHKETYSIFVNGNLYCDLTYVPKNIYNRMPFMTIDGFTVIHPHFMMIDYLRMFTDPIISYWRLDKAMPRFYKLQKYYPLLDIKENIVLSELNLDIYQVILNILMNKKNIIVIGGYAYNTYLKESKLNLKPLNNPFFEVILTNYEKEGHDILVSLKEQYIKGEFKIVEYYPFFMYTGHTAIIYHNNIPIIRLLSNNKRCIPYNTISLNKNDFIQIGTFDVVLLYCMIYAIVYRTNKDIKLTNSYQRMISDLIKMKNKYFKDNKKKITDNTLFESFKVECTGTAIHPLKEYRDNMDKKKKAGSAPLFKYDPDIVKKEPASTFIFMNSSGNPISNLKNLKLIDTILNDQEKLEDEIENNTEIELEEENSV